MTIDERLDRIEHVTAGLAEEGRRYHEEGRTLWRDTQRQIDDLQRRIADTNATITRVSEEVGQRITQLAEESQVADTRLGQRIDALGQRIDALVSGIGEFIRSRQ